MIPSDQTTSLHPALPPCVYCGGAEYALNTVRASHGIHVNRSCQSCDAEIFISVKGNLKLLIWATKPGDAPSLVQVIELLRAFDAFCRRERGAGLPVIPELLKAHVFENDAWQLLP